MCRRKFPSDSVLLKHVSRSALHASNVVAAKDKALLAVHPQYRDRIKERKEIFGEDHEALRGAAAKELTNSQCWPATEAKDKLGSTQNVGTQMLMKMGWREGGNKESDHLQSLRKDFDRIESLAKR